MHLVGKAIDLEDKTAVIHAHFKNEPVALLPGTYVEAAITTDTAMVWALPEGAIIREGNRAFLFMKKENGFEKMEVKIGRESEGYFEILNFEPHPSDVIALEGAYYINGSAE